MCFEDIMKFEDIDSNNILSDKKSNENILTYESSYKTLIEAKTLRIRFDKIDRFIRIYDGNRYLVLFSLEKYDAIYNNIKNFISQESGITYVFLTITRKSKLVLMILCL